MKRSCWFISRLLFALVVCAPLAAFAQGLRPFEPLNPAKAQSLPISPLAIESGGKMHPFMVELAETAVQRNVGLMHRNQLAADRGMLFDARTEQPTQFWMRNTFIPLDMLFIRATGQVAYIVENATPHADTLVGPKRPVRAVLEIPGGSVARLGIKIGDTVHHKIFGNPPP